VVPSIVSTIQFAVKGIEGRPDLDGPGVYVIGSGPRVIYLRRKIATVDLRAELLEACAEKEARIDDPFHDPS
jgi:hypothetical protein